MPSRKDAAQKLYGHPTQDTLPAHQWQHKTEENEQQAVAISYYSMNSVETPLHNCNYCIVHTSRTKN